MKPSELKAIYGLLAVVSLGAALYAGFVYSLAPEFVTDAVPGIEYKLSVAELRTLKEAARAQVSAAVAPLVISMILWVLIGAWWLVRMPLNLGASREFKGAI
jgi:hypothetical protein